MCFFAKANDKTKKNDKRIKETTINLEVYNDKTTSLKR